MPGVGSRLDESARQELRPRAIAPRRKGGYMTQTSLAFGVTLITVPKRAGKYKEGGMKSLKADQGGRLKEKELTAQQEQEVRRLITDKQPEQLKPPFGLWTRSNVSELIFEQ